MTWEECIAEIKRLSDLIDFKPDAIVGIVRGGIVPARLLASSLNVKDMYCLSVKKFNESRQVVTEIIEDVSGKRALLVEDVLETGRSLQIAREYLIQKGVEVKTACLYTMPMTEVTVDFSLQEVVEVPSFPWE